jgi:hypothetical protein
MVKRGKKYILAVLVIILILAITLSLKFYVIYNPIAFQDKEFDQLINWVITNKPSNAPAVQLPRQYSRFSMTGKVYITGDYIFIPSWIGRHTLLPGMYSDDKDCEGYLFAKNNLVYDQPAGDMNQVTVYVPNFSGLRGINSPKGVVKSVMFVDSKINSRWYVLESPPKSVLE